MVDLPLGTTTAFNPTKLKADGQFHQSLHDKQKQLNVA